MVESIFTTQTPAVGDANDGPSTLGTLFTTAVAGTIDGIRWYAPTTLPSSQCQALLYQWTSDTTGTLLGQVAFNVTTPAAWNSVNFASPISIVAGGQRYVAAIFTPDHYDYTNFFFTSSGVTNGNLTAPQNDDVTPAHNGKFIQNATPAYPDQTFRQNCYFVDVLFTASAAPTAIPIGLATETDTAGTITPLAGGVSVTVDRSAETDTARSVTPLAGPVTVSVGLSTETDAALPISPALTPLAISVDRATEQDSARAITPVFNQTVAIGRAEETDSARSIAVHVAGAKTPFYTGPCEVWEPIWCGTLSPAVKAVTGDAVQIATEVLWQASGQRFGLCQVTLRPCRNECADGLGTFDDWWPGVGGTLLYAPRGGPRPWWYNGVWHNVCGSCVGTCSCTVIDEALLPAPTREVVEVRLDGVVMDPSRYRVDENRKLVRLDGLLWPMCQDMAKDDSEVGTWSVTITVGEDVPTLGRRAVGELALELARECAGEECTVPYDITSLARQGVNLSYGSPGEEDSPINQLGLRMVNLFLATFNPRKLRHKGKTYDVAHNPRPWRRTNTS